MPASTPTTTPTARRLTDAAAIRRAWLALEADGHLASAFQRHAWLWTWQEEVGAAEGIEPVVVLVEGTDGVPWMLLPMGLRRWRGGRTLSWLGGDITGYHGPIVGRACPVGALAAGFDVLWAAVQDALPPYDLAHLERQPPRIGPHTNPFLRLGPSISSFYSPVVDLGPDWDAEYRSRASRKTRETARRKERKLGKLGEVEVVFAEDAETVDRIVEALAQQKSAWLAERGLHDLYAGGHLAGLLRRMWREHPDRFHVSAVSVDRVIVATHCGVVSDGAFHYWFASYLPGETQRFSPGELLVRELMAWCCANGVGTFDFGIGDHGYKLRWSDRSVPLHECVVGRTLRGRALVAMARAERVARRRLKESERLYPMALELRAKLRGGGR